MSFLGFGKKKKRPELDIPSVHDLPPLPPVEDWEMEDHKEPSFPSYEKEIGDIEPQKVSVKLPQREKFRKIPSESIVEQGLQNKPIFVEINDYKEALEKIENIKNKIKDAEQVLDEITRLKQEEDRQLESWRREIENIKEKLLDVDQKLFAQL